MNFWYLLFERKMFFGKIKCTKVSEKKCGNVEVEARDKTVFPNNKYNEITLDSLIINFHKAHYFATVTVVPVRGGKAHAKQ